MVLAALSHGLCCLMPSILRGSSTWPAPRHTDVDDTTASESICSWMRLCEGLHVTDGTDVDRQHA